jgi:hypothetical protein
MVIKETSCCGVIELEGIASISPRDAVVEICSQEDIGGNRYANFRFIIFTGVVKELYGQKLKKYILDNKLGTIIETRAGLNPNSHNIIKVWVWTLDRRALSHWCVKDKPDDEEED